MGVQIIIQQSIQPQQPVLLLLALRNPVSLHFGFLCVLWLAMNLLNEIQFQHETRRLKIWWWTRDACHVLNKTIVVPLVWAHATSILSKIRLRGKRHFNDDFKIRNSIFFSMTFNETQHLHSGAAPAPLIFNIFKATVIDAIIFNIFVNSLTFAILSEVREINPVIGFYDFNDAVGFMMGIYLYDHFNLNSSWQMVMEQRFVQLLDFRLCCFLLLLPALFNVTCERFLAVTELFKYNTLMTVPRARVFSLGLWLVGIPVAALNGFMPGRAIYFSQKWHICKTGTDDPSDVDIISTVSVFLCVAMPFGLTLVRFTKLFLLAKYHNAKIVSQERVVEHAGRESDKKALTTFFLFQLFVL